LRVAKNLGFLSYYERTRDIIFLNHEYVSKQPVDFLNFSANSFGISPKNNIVFPKGKFGWSCPERPAKLHKKSIPFLREYTALILENLDLELVKKFWYRHSSNGFLITSIS
jgi:hypothetical protein